MKTLFITKTIFLIGFYIICALPSLQAQSPKFFGLTSQGGKGGTGAIIEYDIESKSLRDPAPTGFTNFASGSQPLWNQLTEYNGKLYGTTSSGGTFFGGVLFEYDPATNSYLKIHDFEQTSFPSGHLTVVDGKLYGTTTSGREGAGVIFEYDPTTNIFSEKYVYTVANRDEAGSTPSGGLVYVEGELYGMTSSGGSNNVGVIFSYNIATGAYTKIRDFDFTRDGGIPYGNLTLYNGDLYGSTTAGGSTGNGTLFKLKGGSFSFSAGGFDVLYYFLEGRDASDTKYPDDGSLTVFNDKLYGMRPKGGFSNIGDNDLGFVFEFDPTDNGITKYDFDGRLGSTPYGSLTVLNDKLYGMTLLGGSSKSGFIFEFLPEETFKFDGYSFDGTNGASPFGSLTAYNGKLYGMTSAGGINDDGVLFEYEPERKIYSKKLDFNFNNGSNPSGSLVKYNGKLFGTADAGGSNNLGVLYEYDPSTESYTKNIDFVGDNGSKPNGRLTAYNGKLYGVTSVGGRFIDHGLIYEYDPESKEYSKGHEFNGLNGSTPIGGLTEYNGILYGVTANGGAGDKGVLFGYDPIRRGLVLIFEFDGTNGVSPRGRLTVHDGKLYGTALGGTTEGGILFAYDPSNGEFTEKYNFEDGKGLGPTGSMIVYNGKLYGLTSLTRFSDNTGGVLFEYDPVTNIYSRKYSFEGNDGSSPSGGLTEYNGKLYGMTSSGDNFYAYGTVFEYDPVNEVFAKNADFNMSNGAFPFGSLTLFDFDDIEVAADAPTALLAKTGVSSAHISFTEPASNGGAPITNYEYQLDGGAWVAFDPAQVTGAVTIEGLSNCVTYSVKLRAVTAFGPGEASGAVLVTPQNGEPEGSTWTTRTVPEANGWFSVAYGNGLFVAVAQNGANRVMTSPDGITWTAQSAPGDNTWMSVAYGNGLFVAVAFDGNNQVMTSPNGIVWTSRTTLEESNNWQSITYGNGLFVAVSINGENQVMTSPDGIVWTAQEAAENNSWRSVTYGNGLFVAVANSGTNNLVMTSPDGITWTERADTEADDWFSVTYGNGLFVALSSKIGSNKVMTSPDGITWTEQATPEEANKIWQSVTFGNGQFVAVAINGTNRVMTSTDGTTWTLQAASENKIWTSVTYGNGRFVAVSSGTNQVMTSEALFAPEPPSIDAITAGVTSLSVEFTPPASEGGSAITNYEYSIDNGANWVTVDPAQTTSTIEITGLNQGTTYQVQLRAVNGQGVSCGSAMVEATTNIAAIPSALIEVTPGTGLDASTFGGSDSFIITNNSTGGITISGVAIDLSTTILPDMVFDPQGLMGEATIDCFNPNATQATSVGLVPFGDNCVDPFLSARQGGFDLISMNFTDFNPDEVFSFSADVDPNSIEGVSEAGSPEAVSGLELVGATVTVTFSDGSTIVSNLFEDGSFGGSQAVIAPGASNAPTIIVDGISSLPATVNNPNQLIMVAGNPGDYLALLQTDSRLLIESGEPPFNVSDPTYFANEAMSKVLYTTVIGGGGTASIPITMLTTFGTDGKPSGGLNQFIAVTSATPYAAGQQVSATSQVITLLNPDAEDPVISNCPINIEVSNDAGTCGAVVTWTPPTASDNRGSVTLESNFAPGDVFPVGKTTVIYTATDGAGNKATCSFEVTVNDVNPPVAPTAPADLNLQCASDIPAPYELTAIDNCSGEISVMPTVTQQSTGPTSVAIKYEWAFIDASGNAVFVDQTINVSDDTAPVPPTAPVDLNLQCGSDIPGSIELTAIDNCGGEITASPSIQVRPGASPNDFELIYTWTFGDASGNVSSISQKITVKDDLAPVPPTAPADLTLQCASEVPAPIELTAIDNCEGEITVSPTQQVIPGSSLNDFVLVRIWTFTDASGNTSSVSQTIDVQDITPPTITCPDDIIETVAFGETSKAVTYSEPTFSDNCAGLSVVRIAGLASGEEFPLGTTTVTYRAIDVVGNTAECSFDVTVTADADTEDPVISNCPITIEVSNDAGTCGAAVSWTPPTATDNSGSVTLTSNFEPGAIFPVGTTTVTYTATDGIGNTASCSFEVTVTDNTPPAAPTPPANLTLQCASDVPAPIELTAIDNCEGEITVSPTQQVIPGSSLNDFVLVRIWTFTDASGNTSSVSQTIDVQDITPPTITCPDDIIETVAFGETSKAVTYSEPTFSDNCAGVSVVRIAGLASGEEFPLGTTTVTYRAIDVVGNTADCSFDVTVTEDADNIAPVLSNCPTGIIQNNENGVCRAVVTWVAPTASDNSGIVNLTSSHNSGDVFPVGETEVTYFATDAAGNQATCSFTVSVEDNELPVLGSVADITVGVPAGQTLTNVPITEPSVSDNCSATVIGVRNDGESITAPYPLGETIITWSAIDPSGNMAVEKQQKVIVERDGQSITAFVLVNSQTDQDLFEITEGMEIDANAIAGLKLNVRAEADPTMVGSVFLSLTGARNVNRTESAVPYALFGDRNGNYFNGDLPNGSYTLTAVPYTESGRRGTEGEPLTVNFSIVEPAVPVSGISVDPTSSAIVSGATVQLTATVQPGNAANKSVTWESSNPGIASVSSSGLVTGNAEGEVTITVMTVDGGFTATATITVVEADTEDPVISNCPAAINVSSDAGTCGAIVTWTPPTATDNSGSVTLESDIEPGDFFPVGITTVIYTARDGAGNTATCSFEVTVVDNELPVLASVTDIEVSVPAGQTLANVPVTEPSVSDNCSATVTGVRNDGELISAPYPLGETIITWSAVDPSGNAAVEVTQKVIVTQQEDDSQRVTRFVLVNAQTNQDLFEITEGMEIDADAIEGLKLNIRAEADPTMVGSVFLSLTGASNVNRTESAAPYALFGDANGNYFDGNLPNGSYTLTAVPYTESGRRGTEGEPLTVNFSIVESDVPVSGISVDPTSSEIVSGTTVQLTATVQPANASNQAVIWGTSNSSIASVSSAGLVTGNAAGEVTITVMTVDGGFAATATVSVTAAPGVEVISLTLIDAGNDEDLFELTDGLVISQSQIDGLTLNARANTDPETVGSVYFTLSGPVSTTRTESAAPYALFGDRNGDYFGRTLNPGTYTLTARAYSERGRGGIAGPGKTVTFTIVTNEEAFRTIDPTGQAEGTAEKDVMETEVPTTMEDQGPDQLVAFPNPIKDGRVSIKDSRFASGMVTYVLYSANGRRLAEGTAEIGEEKTIRLDFSGDVTQAGMYILMLDTEDYLAPKMVRLVFE